MNAPHPNTPDVAATVPAPPVAEAAPPPVTLATLAAFWRSLGYAQASMVDISDTLTAWETVCLHCGAVGPWQGLRVVPFYRPGRPAPP
jgi:hypothetical protein